MSIVSQGMTGKDKWTVLESQRNKETSLAWQSSFPISRLEA